MWNAVRVVGVNRALNDVSYTIYPKTDKSGSRIVSPQGHTVCVEGWHDGSWLRVPACHQSCRPCKTASTSSRR